MSHLLDDEEDDLRSSQDRELTLSTTAILGIFFGLVLLCGLFFAFGYTMGSHHTSPQGDGSDLSTPSSSAPSTSFNSFKPAAGSPASSSGTTYPTPAGSTSTANTTATQADHSTDSTTTQPPPIHAPPVIVDRTVTPTVSVPSTATGTFVVQVAAVTHQEDADLLVSALHAKGYAVTARPSPADQLIHIQVGPFTNRSAADAMRQRLLNDGYNAIVK